MWRGTAVGTLGLLGGLGLMLLGCQTKPLDVNVHVDNSALMAALPVANAGYGVTDVNAMPPTVTLNAPDTCAAWVVLNGQRIPLNEYVSKDNSACFYTTSGDTPSVSIPKGFKEN